MSPLAGSAERKMRPPRRSFALLDVGHFFTLLHRRTRKKWAPSSEKRRLLPVNKEKHEFGEQGKQKKLARTVQKKCTGYC
ncbi:hypothetical protein SUGI_0410360 [Cryptomeria japonica]|nr:hypothetical protein SUGI_0410360 [Cryptomeria japonica]